MLAAGLDDDLSAVGQQTVFAPTDAAFAQLKLDATNVDQVPLATLVDLLLYHLTAGRRDAASVAGARQLRMANGDFARVQMNGDEVRIEDAKVVQGDVAASNGIIHVTDAVLVP